MSTLLQNKTAPLQPGITTEPQSTAGGSAIATPHPDYSARQPDWITMFDTNEGQRHIKSKTTTYLQATSGMTALSANPNVLSDEGLAVVRGLFTAVVLSRPGEGNRPGVDRDPGQGTRKY